MQPRGDGLARSELTGPTAEMVPDEPEQRAPYRDAAGPRARLPGGPSGDCFAQPVGQLAVLSRDVVRARAEALGALLSCPAHTPLDRTLTGRSAPRGSRARDRLQRSDPEQD